MNRFAVALLAFATVAHAGAPIGLGYSTGILGHGIASPAYASVGVAQPLLRQAIARPVAYAQPAAVAVRAEPFDPNPQYNFGYSVSDALTGDQKSQTESRNGDVVQGQYSLVEPDGAIRTVTYTADGINGFNAVVERSPPAVRAVAQPVAVAHAQPFRQAIAQPIIRQAPVAYAQQAYAPAYAGVGQLGYGRAIGSYGGAIGSYGRAIDSFGGAYGGAYGGIASSAYLG